MSPQWSKAAKEYFDKYIYKAIERSGKWMLEKHNLYTPGSGITINAAESFNSVIKRFLNRREVKAQVLALSLYQLDLFYQKEIIKGYSNIGNYCLHENFNHLYQDPKDIVFPKQHLPIDKIPYIFENKDFLPKSSLEGDSEFLNTKYAAAKMIILQGSVTLVPEEQVFVISTINNKKHMVTLFPKETGTCKGKRNCHHIEEARLSVGNITNSQKNVKLSTIVRRNRGHKYVFII